MVSYELTSVTKDGVTEVFHENRLVVIYSHEGVRYTSIEDPKKFSGMFDESMKDLSDFKNGE